LLKMRFRLDRTGACGLEPVAFLGQQALALEPLHIGLPRVLSRAFPHCHGLGQYHKSSIHLPNVKMGRCDLGQKVLKVQYCASPLHGRKPLAHLRQTSHAVPLLRQHQAMHKCPAPYPVGHALRRCQC
jgi:hypothetical protein